MANFGLLPLNAISLDNAASVSATQPTADFDNIFATPGSNTPLQGIIDRQNQTSIASTLNDTVAQTSTQLPYFAQNLNLTGLTNLNTTYAYNSSDSETVNPDSLKGSPNILNDYENVMYHLRFSMAGESVATSATAKNVENMSKEIIAETGVTAQFTIQKFSIHTIAAPVSRFQNMSAITWKMTITEPFGLTLPDYMSALAKKLGVNNEKRFVWFIELWWKGYTEDGKIENKIGDLYKAWRVIITKFDLRTTEAGTTYEIEGIVDNDISNSDQLAMPQSLINLYECKTMENVIDKLKEALNKDAEKAEANKGTVTKYDVVLTDSKMYKWNLQVSNQDQQSNRNIDAKGDMISINRGQDIGNFIMMALSKCHDDMYKWLLDDSEKKGLRKFLMIVPRLEIGKYSNWFNDYERKITFYLIPYWTPRAVSDLDSARTANKLETQIQKFNNVKQLNLLSKRYEYLYTGKNTEVINFDIQADFTSQIILPTYYGSQTYGQYAQGPVVADKSQGFNEQKGYFAKLYQLGNEMSARNATVVDALNNISSGTVPDIVNIVNSVGASATSASGLFNQINSILGSGTTLGNMNFNLQKLSASGIVSPLATLAPSGIIPFASNEPSTLNNLTQNVTGLMPVSSTPSNLPTFAGGGTGGSAKFLELYGMSQDWDANEKWPATFFYDNIPTAQQVAFGGMEKKSDVAPNSGNGEMPNSQTLIGSTLFNMYDPVFFSTITLEIRGDPYWLGMSNLEINDYLGSLASTSTDATNSGTVDLKYANYLKGENMFLLHFKTGTNYSEDTGLMELTKGSQSFNGLYSVTEVESSFENGVFKQTLTAYKDLFSQKVDEKLIPIATTPKSN